jgi:D-sedoheptulose 7-phosphate isomerase
MDTIKKHFLEAQDMLTAFISSPDSFKKIELAAQILVNAIQNGNKIISCGNGGSMCDAMHFAEELSGRYRNDRPAYPAISISDPTHLSCVANDYGYEFVFSRMVEAIGRKGDVLFALSTSGNSENVINAINAAKKKSMQVIGLSGKDGGNMAELCDVEIRAPHSEYADRAQEIHIKVIHALIDYVEQNVPGHSPG